MFSVVKLVLLSRNESDNSIALTARAIRRSYFSRKMIPRLRQILGRELHFDFVARNDADEISAHLSRDMGEHVALPRLDRRETSCPAIPASPSLRSRSNLPSARAKNNERQKKTQPVTRRRRAALPARRRG